MKPAEPARSRSEIEGPGDLADLSVVRRAALGLLKNEATEKVGVKSKRLGTACETAHREQVPFGS